MRFRHCTILFLLLLLASLGWGKEKISAAMLMEKSDQSYYFPSAHGVTDLAVDATIDQFILDPLAKDAKVRCYFLENREPWIEVSNVPEDQPGYKSYPQRVLTPVLQYIMPFTARSSFEGMNLQLQKVIRHIDGVQGTTFYQLIGTMPDTKEGEKEGEKDATEVNRVHQYRVLLDKEGQLYQIENIMTDRSILSASVKTIRLNERWHVSKIITRLPLRYITNVATDTGIVYKVDEISYDEFDGYPLPKTISIEYRDGFNQPMKNLGRVEITLNNYQINAGIAARAMEEHTAPGE